jgi:hypothetical protein
LKIPDFISLRSPALSQRKNGESAIDKEGKISYDTMQSLTIFLPGSSILEMGLSRIFFKALMNKKFV